MNRRILSLALVLSLLVSFSRTSSAAPAAANASVMVRYQVGPIIADRTQNYVYLVDATDNLLLKIDTNTGTVVEGAPIDDGTTTGEMAISVDDSTLYLAESDTNELLVFSTDSMEIQSIVPLSFSPGSIAVGANGRLFAASYYSSEDTASFGYIIELDPTTGAVLQSFGGDERYYYKPLIRTNQAGTNLYATTQGISGFMDLYKYDVSGTTASTAIGYYYDSQNLVDFSPDEAHGIVYLSQGGAYGLDTLTLSTDYEQLWKFSSGTPYGESCSFSANSPFVFAGSGGGEVEEFDRGSDVPVTDTVIGQYDTEINGLAATPNGKAIYCSRPFESSEGALIGIVGLSHLNVSVPYIQPFNPANHSLVFNQSFLQARAYARQAAKEQALLAAKYGY